MEKILISSVILLLDGIGLYMLLTYLFSIPGNKKISNYFNKQQSKENSIQRKKMIWIIMIAVVAINVMVFLLQSDMIMNIKLRFN